MIVVPPLPDKLEQLTRTDYPRVSDAEMQRRRVLVEALLRDKGCDHLIFCGANRTGSVVQWLTHWPVTNEAVGVFTPGERSAMFVQYVNHAELASIIAKETDVSWGDPTSVAAAIGVLKQRKARSGRVAFIGPLGARQYEALSSEFGRIHDLNADYTRFRQVKSEEELDWFRIGAHFADLGMAALRNHLRPGISEIELCALIEQAYVSLGGGHAIHFVGSTPMEAPTVPVPRQYPSHRRIAVGDAVSAEISAAFWDHSGQVLRSFTVGKEPNALYRDLHQAADAAFDAVCAVLRPGAMPADVIEAASVIEEAGFTIIDDLLHGYGGGYLAPILGSKSRPAGAVPTEPFRAGQTVVVQPNVVTRDRKAGVQMGELVVITDSGVERMHRYPRGFETIAV